MSERKTHDVLSMEWIKLELIRTAYATRGGLFAKMDPRVVLLWYLLLGGAPWFTHNITVLAILFGLGVISVIAARVGPLVLGLFVLSLVVEVINVFVVAWFVGGDVGTLLALSELSLKLGAVSLASMAAFVSLDPEKLSSALLALKAPVMLAFSVSYGFRILPILIDEFSIVMEGYQLRGAPAKAPGFLGWRSVSRWGKHAVLAFYPIFLNVATSVRTTVEALETRGLNHSVTHPEGRRLRLSHLQTGTLDWIVVAVTFVGIVFAFWVGAVAPIHR